MNNNIDTFSLYNFALEEFKSSFSVSNSLSLPRIEKLSLSFPLKNLGNDKKFTDLVQKEMLLLTGSIPMVKSSSFSDATLKIRKGQPISIVSTLRREKIFHVLDKIVYVALPRMRDFRGMKRSFDSAGSLSFAIPGDSSVFYEVNFCSELNVNIVFKNSSPSKSTFLLTKIGFPFI